MLLFLFVIRMKINKKIETIIEEFGQVVTGMLMVNGSLSLVGIVLIKLLKVL